MIKKNMDVVIYVAELDVRGGTHKQALRLAEYLNKKNHNVSVFTPVFDISKTYPEFNALNVKYCRKILPHGRIARFTFGILDQINLFWKSRGANVINVHDNRALLFTILHGLFSHGKVVWQINDISPAFSVGNAAGIKCNFSHIKRALSRLAATLCYTITVNVSKNKARVKNFLNRESIVIHCGVDLLDQRKDVPVVSGDINIVSTGIVFRYRNYETLIKGIAVAERESGKKILLKIVGETKYDEPYVSELKMLAARENVDVTFLGAVTQEILNKTYLDAHLFSFVNVDQSWGLAVFEAASMGLPVILSNSVGAVELLTGKPGILVVDPLSPEAIGRSILDLTQNDEIYRNKCSAVSLAVQNMTWDKMYSEKIESIFYEFSR